MDENNLKKLQYMSEHVLKAMEAYKKERDDKKVIPPEVQKEYLEKVEELKKAYMENLTKILFENTL